MRGLTWFESKGSSLEQRHDKPTFETAATSQTWPFGEVAKRQQSAKNGHRQTTNFQTFDNKYISDLRRPSPSLVPPIRTLAGAAPL